MEGSEQLAKLVDTKAGVAHNAAHRECVDWIVPWDGKDTRTVGHDDVRTLTNDAEPGLFKSSNGAKVVDPGKLYPKLTSNRDPAPGYATATSTTRPSEARANSSAASTYSRIATRILARASSSVAP